MKNKMAGNIVIVGAMLLGTGYVIEKSRKNRCERILKNINNNQDDKSENYILTGEFYNNLMNGSNNQINNEADFSKVDRNYIRLK